MIVDTVENTDAVFAIKQASELAKSQNVSEKNGEGGADVSSGKFWWTENLYGRPVAPALAVRADARGRARPSTPVGHLVSGAVA